MFLRPINLEKCGQSLRINQTPMHMELLMQPIARFPMHSYQGPLTKRLMSMITQAKQSIHILSANIVDSCIWSILMERALQVFMYKSSPTDCWMSPWLALCVRTLEPIYILECTILLQEPSTADLVMWTIPNICQWICKRYTLALPTWILFLYTPQQRLV